VRAVKILLAFENNRHHQAIGYALKRLFFRFDGRLLLCQYDKIPNESFDLAVFYGKEKPDVAIRPWLYIRESDFFQYDFPTDGNLPRPPFHTIDDSPVLFGNASEPLRFKENGVEIYGDLVASTFFLLSRYEEHVLPEKDDVGRFPVRASVLGDPGFYRQPLIDEYTWLIQELLKKIGVELPPKKLWGDRDFAICLTHDIDHLRGGWKELMAFEARRFFKDRSAAVRFIRYFISWLTRQQDPYDNIDRILALEEKFNAHSSFFFLSDKGRMNADYDVNSSDVRDSFECIRQNSDDIGLHGSYHSLSRKGQLEQEKERLEAACGQSVMGNRQHFLRFRIQDFWQQLKSAGLSFDSSLGFSEMAGYRAGTSMPFFPFDVDTGREIDVLEIPLVIMDTTLRLRERVPNDNVFDFLLPFLQRTKKQGTCLTVLWHNTYFTDGKHTGYREAYEKLLAWTLEHNGWLCSAGELYQHWTALK